jgi:hypothetical protein
MGNEVGRIRIAVYSMQYCTNGLGKLAQSGFNHATIDKLYQL